MSIDLHVIQVPLFTFDGTINLYKREYSIYLDNNATTRPLPEVRDTMLQVLTDSFANASSSHSLGRVSRTEIVRARDMIGALVGALPEQVVFTSGGTEANNQVLLSQGSRATQPVHIVTSAIEHSSILKVCKFLQENGRAKVTLIPVDKDGQIDLESLEASITDRTAMVSVQWVNNEIGSIQDIVSIGKMCHKAGVLFHTDAAQAVGKMEINFERIPADFITLTAHKMHGPQGIGAIIAKDLNHLKPILHGGPQEFGLRSGTENLPGIVGFGKAAELRLSSLKDSVKHLQNCRDQFEKQLLGLYGGIGINGGSSSRICNTSNLLFHGIEGIALVAQLDAMGIYCSQSSACTNQRPEPSYVLSAMGLSEDDAYASVRFCFAQDNTLEEVEKTVAAIRMVLDGLKN